MRILTALLCAAVVVATTPNGALVAATASAQDRAAAGAIPNDPAAIAHALNRVAYGPRPGQIEEIQRGGLSGWIDAQLNSASIPDSQLAAVLPALPERPAS